MRNLIFLLLIPAFGFILSTNAFGQESSTNEGDSVRDVVRQKVEEARKNPKAYIGTLTDKTETSLELRNETGEILQISVNEDEVSIAKTGDASFSLKFADVAIGDFVVAMGYKSPNGVLDARRILVTSAIEKPARKILVGTVTASERNLLTVSEKETGQEFEVTPARNIRVTLNDEKNTRVNFSTISEGDEVIAVNAQEGDDLEARRIHVIVQAEN